MGGRKLSRKWFWRFWFLEPARGTLTLHQANLLIPHWALIFQNMDIRSDGLISYPGTRTLPFTLTYLHVINYHTSLFHCHIHYLWALMAQRAVLYHHVLRPSPHHSRFRCVRYTLNITSARKKTSISPVNNIDSWRRSYAGFHDAIRLIVVENAQNWHAASVKLNKVWSEKGWV